MVKIRLQRFGTKKRPFYRIVAADARRSRDGRFLERLGTYDPVGYKKSVVLKNERIEHWLKCGALPTDTVQSILTKHGLMEKKARVKK